MGIRWLEAVHGNIKEIEPEEYERVKERIARRADGEAAWELKAPWALKQDAYAR